MKVGVPMDAIFPAWFSQFLEGRFPRETLVGNPAFVKLKGHLISLNGNLAAHRGAGCSEVIDVYVDLLIFQKFVYSNS